MNFYDYIDDYKANKLSDALKADFEHAMGEDANLRQLVDQYDELKSVSEGILEVQLLDELKGIGNDLSSTPDDKSNWFRYFMYAMSFIILASIIYLLFLKEKTETQPVLFAEAYTEPIWPTTRSTTTDKNDMYYKAKAASDFFQKDYASAKLILLDSMQDKTLGRYWLAEMYMARQEFDSVGVYLPDVEVMTEKQGRIQQLRMWLNEFNN